MIQIAIDTLILAITLGLTALTFSKSARQYVRSGISSVRAGLILLSALALSRLAGAEWLSQLSGELHTWQGALEMILAALGVLYLLRGVSKSYVNSERSLSKSSGLRLYLNLLSVDARGDMSTEPAEPVEPAELFCDEVIKEFKFSAVALFYVRPQGNELSEIQLLAQSGYNSGEIEILTTSGEHKVDERLFEYDNSLIRLEAPGLSNSRLALVIRPRGRRSVNTHARQEVLQWLTIVSLFVERQLESKRMTLSKSLSVATRRLGVSEGKLMSRMGAGRINDVRALEYVNGAITGALAGLFDHDKIITELTSRQESVAQSITRTTESGSVKVQFFPERHSLRTLCSQTPERFVLIDVASSESDQKGISRLRGERLNHALVAEFEISSEKSFVLAFGSLRSGRLSPWLVDVLSDFASALESLLELAFVDSELSEPTAPEKTASEKTASEKTELPETKRILTAGDRLRSAVGLIAPERHAISPESERLP